MTSTAFVPMRLGSKGIPKKNIKLIAGRPLYHWTLSALIEAQVFNQIIVSTESSEIARAVEKDFGTAVKIHPRSEELALDTTSTEAVLLDKSLNLQSDWLGLFQVTSPFITKEHIQEAAALFQNSNYDSLLSVCEFKRFLWSHEGVALNYEPLNRPRRQDFKGCYIENGAFYFMHVSGLKAHGCRLFGTIGTFVLPEEFTHEIDSPQDFVLAESLLKQRISP